MTDGKGLYLLLHPNGSKYWRMKYQFSGKEKTLAFGVWPEVSLTEAREMRNEAPLKVSDLLKFGPRPIRKKKERDDAVKILADLGWIQVRKWRNSKIILLHPSIGKM